MCASCATQVSVDGAHGAEDVPPWSRIVESFFVAVPGAERIDETRSVRRSDVAKVTVIRLSATPDVELRRGASGDGGRDRSEIAVNVTPWRYAADGRRPVGVVWSGEVLESAPQPPYWALVVDREGRWSMRPQESWPASAADEYRLALGAFYPLVRDGLNVADGYPGRQLRSARVAVGGNAHEAMVIVAEGSRVGPGPGRAGLTTGELADVMMDVGVTWALNLDGGRSALVMFSGGTALPRRIPLRRPGPVVISIYYR